MQNCIQGFKQSQGARIIQAQEFHVDVVQNLLNLVLSGRVTIMTIMTFELINIGQTFTYY